MTQTLLICLSYWASQLSNRVHCRVFSAINRHDRCLKYNFYYIGLASAQCLVRSKHWVALNSTITYQKTLVYFLVSRWCRPGSDHLLREKYRILSSAEIDGWNPNRNRWPQIFGRIRAMVSVSAATLPRMQSRHFYHVFMCNVKMKAHTKNMRMFICIKPSE